MYGSSSRHRGGRGRGRGGGRSPGFSPPVSILRREAVAPERAEAAAARAWADLLSAGQSASTWKVAQSAALLLQVSSWDAVGLSVHEVPSLRNLQFVEGKVNAFIHCFVCTRRMTSVYELDIEICKNEGVEKFEELGLGPLLRHPLVQHYFLIPPDATEIFKITVEDMIARLTVFQYRKKHKEFTVEEFLDFLVKKHSAASRENLGVRIQSLGFYIKFIRNIKRTEDFALKSIQESGLPRKVQQNLLDDGPEHLDYLSNLTDNCFTGNNRTTSTVGADDDGNGESVHFFTSGSQNGKKQKGRRTEFDEMKKIGMKLAIFNYQHDTKESCGDEEKLGNRAAQPYEIVQVDPRKAQKLSLTTSELEKFVANWEGACQKHSVQEVLAMMLHIYKLSDKRRRKMESLFLNFPAVGLLNVAVTYIKSRAMKSPIKELSEHFSPDTSATAHTEMTNDESSVEENLASEDEKPAEKAENSISAEDIIKQIAKYFVSNNHVPKKRELLSEEQLVIHDCELWLTTQFCVKDFGCLGHGSFLKFMEKYVPLILRHLHYLITEGFCMKTSLEVSMLQKQFFVLLFQAAKYLDDRNSMNLKLMSVLLKKQFPSITFQISGNAPDGRILDLVNNQKDLNISSSVIFSVALLGNYCQRFMHKEVSEESFKTEFESVGYLGSVSEKDAIECLLKAPKLSDLQSWSHWDIIFAPSLGPLLEWLLNMGPIEELACIVTSDGRMVRIDQLATVDEFLEASIQCSSFQAAVKLLSLFSAYGGIQRLPVSLLKCYCQRAFDVILNNYTTQWESSAFAEIPARKSFQRQCMHDADDDVAVLLNTHTEVEEGTQLSKDLLQLNKAYSLIAVFIRDCLGYLPSEFRSTAADILVSGLLFFTKDASLIILSVCKLTNERIMLHDIGLSIGIMEWVEDYQTYNSATTANLSASSQILSQSQQHYTEHDTCLKNTPDKPNMLADIDIKDKIKADSTMSDGHQKTTVTTEEISGKFAHGSSTSREIEVQDAALLIETIRREEFGLDPNLEDAESNLLTKQHARLGRALHCLSQELYSQDSHFILELVQNADDNSYPENVEPTLAFILQADGVVVMNNEEGFYAQNMRALCDVGNSTKKGSNAGYIGKKGIGFKSVFRVTDAPEIHSNGFHVKFDITDGQIGFVLPTIVSACNIDDFKKQLSYEFDRSDDTAWNTCIVLPFNSKIKQGMGISSIISMFSDLHPSLLLFLRQLQCIKLKSMLDGKLVSIRKQTLDDGIVRISHGDEEMNWLVVNKDLQASNVRHDVQNTKIAIAFTLQDSDNGNYKPILDQQPVFAFLPLRKYGLKFIMQGDFLLPSSREDIDGDSAWNQWLMSEFPDLFVSAEKSFCALPCYKESPGKAVTAFMSFVPLIGEVHGFFSQLPHVIVSRLRMSNCLLLDGANVEWVPPCRVVRNWNEQARTFLPETLLQQHLGLGYLSKDIILSDSLANALSIQEYGPALLVGLLSSICHLNDGIMLLGLNWLSSFLDALYTSFGLMPIQSGCLSSAKDGTESNFLNRLREIPFIPLSDGSYGSLATGPIWLPCDLVSCRFVCESSLEKFPGIRVKLRIVSPLLFSTADGLVESRVDNIIRMLCKIGVQQLSAHDIIQIHIMPFISAGKLTRGDTDMMVEYLTFIMIHLQSPCSNCKTEKADLILTLQTKSTILTNHGFKSPIEEPIHFSEEFGNVIDVKKLIDNTETKWNEVDSIYLKHPGTLSLAFGLTKWRRFFQELGVTDFVQLKDVEKNVADVMCASVDSISCYRDIFKREISVRDWESPELVHLLSTVSENKCLNKSKYLMEVLDKLWDDSFTTKVKCYSLQNKEEIMPFESSFMKSIHNFKWVACSIDEDVHCPLDLFHDCESVRSILGAVAPYAVPKVTSKRFLDDIGFKVQVTLDDALEVFQYWISTSPSASISQMSNLYTFIRDELSSSREKITEVRSRISIFIPLIFDPEDTDVVPGIFMPPEKVYWHDPTGCLDQLREGGHLHNTRSQTSCPPCMTLANLYPNLHDFLVNACGVGEAPPLHSYLQILLQLSRSTSPSQSAHQVFQFLLRFADGLSSGNVTVEETLGLKESLLELENTVLPTVQGKWVSLNAQFGLICWSDDDELMEQYVHLNDVYFLQFGELTALEKEMLSSKVAALMQNLGIRALAEVLSREAIIYGIADSTEVASLVHWVLPYAQRYLYKLHPDVYFRLKQHGFEKVGQLQVICIEKLFYRYSLNGHDGANRKRYECSCLLQGNVLYTTPIADFHSIFLQLSRFFFHGNPNLQIANFLDIITSKAKLGSTEEQIESFVVNSQKVPELPEGEILWSSSSLLTTHGEISLPVHASPMITNRLHLNRAKKRFTGQNWPPANWKASPDLLDPSMIHVIEKPVPAPVESTKKSSKDAESIIHSEDGKIPTRTDGKNSDPVGAAFSVNMPNPDLGVRCLPPIIQRDSLCLGTPEEEQCYETGRVGEIVAYKYFCEKLGSEVPVRWVNEESETGLPYDLILESGSREYIEVKSTTSASKDWFPISTKEFQYASEKGDSFSIARVILSSPTDAEIFVLRNPLKLCQQNVLQLALLVPNSSQNSST